MERQEITARVREIIASVANLDPEKIAADASFIEDLALDSLSLLEIGVDVDYAFKLGVPEERLQQLQTVAETVDLVEACLKEADSTGARAAEALSAEAPSAGASATQVA